MSKFLTLDGLSHFLSKIKGIFVGAATNTTEDHVVTFGADGKTIKDSGYTIASNVPANAKFTDTTYSTATTSKNGLMSSTDKTKLDGIATGANNYTLPAATSSTLGGVKTGSNITNTSGTISLTKANVTAALGYTPPTTDTTYSVATTSANGLMSSTDKSKLDGIAAGAQVNVIESVKVNGTALTPASKAVNIDLSTYALKSSLSSYATTSSLSAYAKKTDIANVYLYKGSVPTYSELPKNATAGWVYNVEAADDANNIKAGDNVAWNGTAWDNLSGILDIGISEITTDEIDTLFS